MGQGSGKSHQGGFKVFYRVFGGGCCGAVT